MTHATYLQREAQVDRFGLKVASALDDLPLAHDISERLRIARQMALAQHKIALASQVQASSNVFVSGSAAILGGNGNDGFSWMNRLLSALPIIALAVGLVAINMNANTDRANELAEVDTQLLIDDLPPAAHADAGFAQYLKFGPPASTSSTSP